MRGNLIADCGFRIADSKGEFQSAIRNRQSAMKVNAPGTPQRRPTSLSAAPCEGLTRFTSGRPADLGHPKLACRLPVLYRRRTTPPPLRARASRLLEQTLHRVHA